MQSLVDKLREEIKTKRNEELQQQQNQHRVHTDGQLVEDLQQSLMESENLVQIKSEQVLCFFLIVMNIFFYKF